MPYPTPCAVNGCVKYVNLDKPLPSNLQFICPECEDKVMQSLLGRLARDGYCSEDAAAMWVGVLKHWRIDKRRGLDIPLRDGMRIGN